MKIDEIEENSEQIREILAKQPNVFLKWGITVIFIAILLMFFITWLIKYPDVISSEGIITTQVPPQKEYANTTARITALLVEDKQVVESNTPLAILENTANYRDVFDLKLIIDKTKINNRSFYFPIDSIPFYFLGDIETQFASFENSYSQYLLNKELKPFSNEALANRYSISELNRRLKGIQSQKKINETELKLINRDLARNKTLFEKGVISAQDYEDKQLEYSKADRDFKDFESSISQINEEISNATKIYKGTNINREKEERALLKNVVQSFNQLKKAIKDWERLYVFKSNFKGKVSYLNYWNINQNVSQGDLVFTIIPLNYSSFIAKLRAPAQNFGKIKIGQKVNINLENYPTSEFGVITGKVKNMSLIPNNDGFYLIDVHLPKTLVTSYNIELDFKQEMQVTGEIITEDLRLLERIFYQFKKIFKS